MSTPLRVAYDTAPIALNQAGERRYALELLRALRRRGDVAVQPVGPGARRPGGLRQRVALQAACEGLLYPWRLPRAARRGGAELVHFPRHLVTATRGIAAPVVVTIHDVFPLRFPDLYPALIRERFRAITRRVAWRADLVLTGSEYSRREIVALLGVAPERVRVTPYAVDARFRPDPPSPAWLRERLGLERRYVVCVGTLEPRKNLRAVLTAFDHVPPAEAQLVVIGGRGWKHAEADALLAGRRDRVTTTGRVSDAELVRLLSGAACFVHAAVAEGFGFPVLEAMACGTPVIAHAGGSVPEVVGDAGVLVDAFDAEALAAGVRHLLADSARAEDLAARGCARAAGYTWQATAAATVAAYRSLTSEQGRDFSARPTL